MDMELKRREPATSITITEGTTLGNIKQSNLDSQKVRPSIPPPPMKSKSMEEETQGLYFARTKKENLEFISSGNFLLDCVLGGGWPLGRMSNIVGDRSTGKSLLAIEACANFRQKYPKGKIIYLEAEAAFDEDYAEALGMPVDSIEFAGAKLPDYTVESWFEHLESTLETMVKTQEPCLYIVDSLDALSDRAEKDREIDKGTFGANKPKIIGQLFRRTVKDMERSRIHLMIISQIRDNLGVSFGETKTRTGGRAMDFYASQILWLAQLKRLDRTIRKQKRVYGIQVKAQCKKNKIGLPFREAEFPILFGYGMDEAEALLTWLESIDFDISIWNEFKDGKLTLSQSIKMLEVSQRTSVMKDIKAAVAKNWEEIETRFLPTVRKY
jgi:recombination protein RecA